MTNTAQEVNSFLLKNPSIIKNMHNNLINIRALAQLIKTKENLDASIHAIHSAIRRFDIDVTKLKLTEVDKILKLSKISTKSRLVFITLERDFSFLAKTLPKILNIINPSVGEVLIIVEGRERFKILVDHSKKDEILSLVNKSYVKDIVENLAEINIHFTGDYVNVRGIRSTILNEISINNIDVDETISCLPEFMIILKEKDIGKAHDILLSFFYK